MLTHALPANSVSEVALLREAMSDGHDFAREPVATFFLPFPPTVNHCYRNVTSRRTGRRGKALTDEAKLFRDTVILIVARSGWREPIVGEVSLEVMFVLPDRRQHDVGNCDKALLDALKHAGVYHDDFQVCDQRFWRSHLVKSPGYCVVKVYRLTDA